jgi:aspartate 1-decarboxylase
MHAKLHRVRVTAANVNYVGSITIDELLLEKTGILPLEEVEIVNISNGNRWKTYVLPGEPGSGCVEPNGGGALLSSQGDILIIYAMEERQREDVYRNGHVSRVILSNERNEIEKMLEQRIEARDSGLSFCSDDITNQSGPSMALNGVSGNDAIAGADGRSS